jgi:hypothetical protein
MIAQDMQGSEIWTERTDLLEHLDHRPVSLLAEKGIVSTAVLTDYLSLEGVKEGKVEWDPTPEIL